MKTINPIRTISDEEIKKVRSFGYIKIIHNARFFLLGLIGYATIVFYFIFFSFSLEDLEEYTIFLIIVPLSFFVLFIKFVFGVITSLKYFRVKKDEKVYMIKDKLRYRFYAIKYSTTFHLGEQSAVLLPELYMDLSKIGNGALAEVEAIKTGKRYVILNYSKVED